MILYIYIVYLTVPSHFQKFFFFFFLYSCILLFGIQKRERQYLLYWNYNIEITKEGRNQIL